MEQARADKDQAYRSGRADRRLAIIVLIALLLRVGFFLAVQPWDPEIERDVILQMDADGYHNRAVEIVETGGFSEFGTYRTPLYPLFLAGVYSLAGAKPYVALAVQLVIGAATVLLVHAWAKRSVGAGAALVAAAVFALQPLQIQATSTLLTETLFILGLLASVLVLMMGLEQRRVLFMMFSGLLLGLTTLVRPATQYFPVVAVAIILLYRCHTIRFRSRASVVLVLAFLVALAPWLYRNYSTYGALSLTTFQGKSLVFFGMTQVEMARTGKSMEEVRDEFREISRGRGLTEDGNPFENERIYREIVVERIMADVPFYVKMHALSVVKMFGNLSTSSIGTQLRLPAGERPLDYYSATSLGGLVRHFLSTKSPQELVAGAIILAVLALTYLSAAVGIAWSLRGDRRFYLLVLLLILLYFSAAVGPMGQARYRLPIAAFYIAWSGRGFVEMYRFFRNRLRGRGRECGSASQETEYA